MSANFSHRLEVAYSSDVQIANPSFTSALAYGFAVCDPSGGPCFPIGQKGVTIEEGSDFYFAIYDTASVPSKVSEIKIILTEFETADNPFGWTDSRLILKPDDLPKPSRQTSVGCNVVGLCWLLGPYLVQKDSFGSYHCTVKVTTAADVESTEKKRFEVDPRIIVEGGSRVMPPPLPYFAGAARR